MEVETIVCTRLLFLSISSHGHPNLWDVSLITDMSELFAWNGSKLKFFNENISDWNVSNVTNMKQMFGTAEVFNQPIEKWNA